MKNMGTLYGYELKKLLKRPLTWTVALLMTAFSVFTAQGGLRADFGHRFYSEPAGDDSWAGELIEFIPEADWNARMLEGGTNAQRPDDGRRIFQAMRENVPQLGDHSELEFWFYHEDPTYYHAYSMVDSVTSDDPHNVTAESFYAGRQALLEQRWENYGLSEEEKDYWQTMEEQIEQPFVYEYPWNGIGMNGLFTTLYTLIVPLALAAAICLCQTFSKDRSTRVDALIFVSRKCRLPLFLSKILAGATGALLMAALILGGHMTVYLARYGTEGLNASLQMLETVYSLPVSVGESILYMLLLVALYTLACGALTMLVSALTRRTVTALIVPVIFMYWLTQSRLTAPYLPHNLITWDGFLNVSLFKVLGVYLNIFQVGLLLYPLLAVVLFALCWLGWRRTATSLSD